MVRALGSWKEILEAFRSHSERDFI